jgi:hypothetical protein
MLRGESPWDGEKPPTGLTFTNLAGPAQNATAFMAPAPVASPKLHSPKPAAARTSLRA